MKQEMMVRQWHQRDHMQIICTSKKEVKTDVLVVKTKHLGQLKEVFTGVNNRVKAV